MAALALLCTTGCAARPESLTAAHAAAIRDSVHVALDGFRRYSAAGQWDSLLTLYAEGPDLRWVEEGEVKVRSIDQIRAYFTGLPPGMKIETTYRDIEIAPLAPGAASVVTGFETGLVDSTGKKFSFGGMLTMVLVHREGRWQIITGHSSTPGRRGS
jgi:hypothetical protein